ncbi:MAG: hypothetical protein K2K56_07985 [Lachnospiraceae bacterium]|nr:hypothetical protein [Lachnospiraceae bacterium]MDE6626295.1 hypothetical protein [Lachnospiraceae bacterium]
MDDNKQVEDIVAMLDNMMGNGHGHVNVSIDENIKAGEKSEVTMGCTDCAKGDLACSVPTLMEGMDEELRED